MGLRGPLPKARGTPPLKPCEGDPPPPPGELGARAAEVWRDLAAILHAAGTLTPADHFALACYCRAIESLEDALRHVALEGPVLTDDRKRQYKSPWATERDACIAQMVRLSACLGLSPADRARIGSVGAAASKAPRTRAEAQAEAEAKAAQDSDDEWLRQYEAKAAGETKH